MLGARVTHFGEKDLAYVTLMFDSWESRGASL